MSFEAHDRKVSHLFTNTIYCIPRNQRGYVWGKEHWDDLYDDIEHAEEAGETAGHFIGSVVLQKEDARSGVEVRGVIDGQQRILSLTILMCSIMFTFKKRGLCGDFSGTEKYLRTTDDKGRPMPLVDSENHPGLSRLVNGILDMEYEEATQLTASILAKRCKINKRHDPKIMSAFEHYCGKVATLEDDELVVFRTAVLDSNYVDVVADTEENAYTIFEILNARGTDLDDHELLKNYIMRYMQPRERRDEAKDLWVEIQGNAEGSMPDFFRHYAIHKFRYDSSNDRSVYKKIQRESSPRNVSMLLDDLVRKSRYYHMIQHPENCRGVEADVFRFFKTQNARQFRPIMLSLMHRKEEESITLHEYEYALKFLKNFYLCYRMIGKENGNNLTGSIAKRSYELETDESHASYQGFLEAFRAKMPSIESFRTAMASVGYSHSWPLFKDDKSKKRCKLALALLESSESERPLGEFTIEHILSDADSEANAQIGNLLPLESSLNGRCKDRPLEQKLEYYELSEYVMTRAFAANYANGRPFDPAERTNEVAAQLYALVVPA